jgi:aryl-alcohol dehydrogenase-like predicted oxidoreductase/predicted kinase
LELRIGLGCMRLSAEETITAAAAAGVTVFDTARAYGDNERLLAAALRRAEAERSARIVTKGGMRRVDGAWVPDGRTKAIRSDCEASLAALDGIAIDLYLVHAPDPRTPWATSVRALARLADEGVVKHVGVANVNRRQLDEALALAPIAAVQVALSLVHDRAVRGGVVERCAEEGIAVVAHSPLGGPRRAAALARHRALADVAAGLGATPQEVALAWLLQLAPNVVAIPGARRPETARSSVRAARLELGEDDHAALARAFGRRAPAHVAQTRPAADGEVVLVMGIPGAGKSRVAEELVGRGYVRINRDERGGSLLGVADALETELAAGARRVVLDNTYLTRASRSYVIETASRHRVPVRCVWLDTPLAQAQVNLVARLLERFGSLPTPEELRERARREQGLLVPTSQMRAVRELEPPSGDEGLAAVEQREFVRASDGAKRPGVFVAAAALDGSGRQRVLDAGDRTAPHLVFDWRPDGSADELAPAVGLLAAEVSGPVESAVCPHAGGPPRCWCRPPLPGLPLAFARRHDIDPAQSVLIGTSAAHRTLAKTLGARYVS